MPKARKRTFRCKVCGRELKNAESIARGMGPTCERRVIGVVSRIRPGRPKGQSAEYEPIALIDLGEGE